MAALDDFFCTSIGTSAMQSQAYTLRIRPELKDGQVNAYVVEMAVDGFIEATGPADLATKLQAFHTACATPKQNILVKGMGGAVEFDLPAARCLDGGPFVVCEVLDGISPMQRRVRVTVSARQGGGDEVSIADQTWHGFETRKVSTETRPDGLHRAVVSGELKGPNLDQLFTTVVLPRERAKYPTPAWTVSHRIESNTAGDRYTYEVRAEENAEPGKFPVGPTFTVAEMVTDVRREVDAHQRITTTHTFDMLVTGDPAAVETAIRTPIVAAGTIVRESFAVTGGREKRVRAAYVVLSSNAAGRVLLEWSQSFEAQDSSPVARAINHEGIRTVLAYSTSTERKARQSGRAVGVGKYVQAPDPAIPSGYAPSAPPTRRYNQLNRYEFETTWAYEFVGVDGVAPSWIASAVPKLGPPVAVQTL